MKIQNEISGHKKNLFVLYILTTLLAIILISIPFFEGALIDSLVYTRKINVFINYCFVLLSLGIARLIVSFFTMKISIVRKEELKVFLNKKILEKIFRKDTRDILNFDMSYLNFRIDEDLEEILSFKFESIPFLISNLITSIWIIIYFFRVNKIILLTLIILIPVYFVLFTKFGNKVYDSTYKLSEIFNKYKALKNSIYNRYVFIKSNEYLQKEMIRMDLTEQNLIDEKKENFNIYFKISAVKISITLLFQILFFLIGGYSIFNNLLTIGVFTVSVQYFSILLNTIDEMLSVYTNFKKFSVSIKRIEDISHIKNDEIGNRVLSKIDSVKVSDFNYFYEENRSLYAEKINCTFERGNIYSVLGKNGVGKSTFILNIIGLLNSSKIGQIYYNNIKIQNINTIELREKLISVSISSNLEDNRSVKSYLTSIKEWTEIVSDLNNSLLNDFFDNEYFSIYEKINSDMDTLSSGERQMVYLLGTVIKENAQIFIFDEPSANLYEELIPKLKKLLSFLSKDNIVILISHDSKLIDKTNKLILEGSN